MARGMLSDIPIVRGLGPREEPIGIDVVLNVTLLRLDTLSARSILLGAGLIRPAGLAVAFYNTKSRLYIIHTDIMRVTKFSSVQKLSLKEMTSSN